MDFQLLYSLMKMTKGFAHGQVKESGLNDTECMICSYVYAHENCSQDDISKGLCMDKTTIAKAVLGLENKNFIMRIPDKVDKRRNVLNMTSEGMNKCSQILNLHNDWMSRLMEELSENEQKQFESYCNRLIEAAKRIRKESKEEG